MSSNVLSYGCIAGPLLCDRLRARRQFRTRRGRCVIGRGRIRRFDEASDVDPFNVAPAGFDPQPASQTGVVAAMSAAIKIGDRRERSA